MPPHQAFLLAQGAQSENFLIKMLQSSAKSALSGFTPVQKAHHLSAIACLVLPALIGLKAFAPFVLLEPSAPSSEQWIQVHACRVIQDFTVVLDLLLVYLALQGPSLRLQDLQLAYSAPLEHSHFLQTLTARFAPPARFLSMLLHLASLHARGVLRTHFRWKDLLIALFWSAVLEPFS